MSRSEMGMGGRRSDPRTGGAPKRSNCSPAPEIMIIAGEASGDAIAADLVRAIRGTSPVREWRFFGAGGPAMRDAGVDLAFDLTAYAVFGLSDVLRQLFQFRRLFNRLLRLASERKPAAIVLVDYGGFNRRFAKAIRRLERLHGASGWKPKIIYYVPPQVWASRPGRANQLARDVDLLLTILPFEKEWYAARMPELAVEFVGHPLLDRHAHVATSDPSKSPAPVHEGRRKSERSGPPLVILLPGSRRRELQYHLPVMVRSLEKIRERLPVRAVAILPSADVASMARAQLGDHSSTPVEIESGTLARMLPEADLAIASSGTVTLECALYGVPAVVLYKTSWLTYSIAKRIVRVRFIAMPNILANESVFPELIQSDAAPEGIAEQALDLLSNPDRRRLVQEKLVNIRRMLGGPGASARAAASVLRLLERSGNLQSRGEP